MALSDIVKTSPKLGYGEFGTLPSDNISNTVDVIRQILLDAGWEQTGSVQATASLSFPLGFPVARGLGGGGLGPSNRVAAFYGVPNGFEITFQFFDLSVGDNDPTSTDLVHKTKTIGVPIGSAAQSAERLAEAMSAGIWITSIVTDMILGPVGIDFVAAVLGTAGNNFDFEGTGSFSTGSGLSKGGGWVMRSSSQQQRDIDAGASPVSVNTTRTSLIIANGAPAQNGLQIHVEVDGLSAIDYYTQQSSKWMLWANPFMARFESDAPFHAGDVFVFNSFLWCGSIALASEVPLDPVGFIWSGSGVPGTLGQGSAFAVADTVAASKTHTGGFSQNECSIAFYHYQSPGGGVPIQTRMGKSLLMPALVMMVCSPPEGMLPDEARICGYMWDAFLETAHIPPGTIIVQEGQPYRAVMTQNDNTVGTMWLRWPVKPPDTGTSEPVPPPTFSGTCNVFGPGVTRLTGDPFTPALEGRTLYINGQPFKVLTVIDSDHLNLDSSAAGIQANVPFNT